MRFKHNKEKTIRLKNSDGSLFRTIDFDCANCGKHLLSSDITEDGDVMSKSIEESADIDNTVANAIIAAFLNNQNEHTSECIGECRCVRDSRAFRQDRDRPVFLRIKRSRSLLGYGGTTFLQYGHKWQIYGGGNQSHVEHSGCQCEKEDGYYNYPGSKKEILEILDRR